MPADVYLQRFAVPFEFPVYFTEGVLDADNPVLVEAVARLEPERRHRLFVAIDAGVTKAWPDLERDLGRYVAAHADELQLACPPVTVPGGERCKNDPAELAAILGRLHALGMDRQAFVVIIGGGAVQDMVGYAAATAHRGLRVVRVPTTVLSQNDSGVGVKNAVNAFGAKNFLGTFAPPFAVIDDVRFLTTLSKRDRRAGMAEAVKVALIRDAGFYWWLRQHVAELAAFDNDAMASMIRKSAELHLAHIAGSGDPFELGNARPLDYGHWSAHKLEVLSDYEIRHGEAVAIGMALDARYAVEVGLLSEECLGEVCTMLEALGLPLWHDALSLTEDGRRVVLGGLDDFREHLGGELSVRLLTGIGASADVHAMDESVIERAIGWLEVRARCN